MNKYFILFLLIISYSVVAKSAVSYARGEFCFEDRFVSNDTDDDFNEACMQYHIAIHYSGSAGSAGTVWEFVLALTPKHSGASDDIDLIVNPDLSAAALTTVRMDRSSEGVETNHGGIRHLRTKCDYVKCVWYEP